MQFSPIMSSRTQGDASFKVTAIDLMDEINRGSPVLVLDEFHVRGRPFPPHPHAGFSAVTYVMRDSEGGLRSRDSLGNDVTVGGGGMVWTLAGSGVIHHEVPAFEGPELHGLQLFVNLTAANKSAPPRMQSLSGELVPRWHDATGGGASDVVHVVVGSYQGVTSPLMPLEPFTFLDIDLHTGIGIDLQAGDHALVYVVRGGVEIADRSLASGRVMAARGDGRLELRAQQPAHAIVMIGRSIHEPVVMGGNFIMNSAREIELAHHKYRNGEMGRLLAPAFS